MPKAVKKDKWQKGCMVKGRNEPVAIIHVAHVIASVKGISVEEVCEAYVLKAISQVHGFLLTVLLVPGETL